MKIKLLLLVVFFTAIIRPGYGQYPEIPRDVEAASEKLLKDAWQKSEIAWHKAWPVIQEDARKGKPYIPWAARPTDLPQAEIPAFPGAMGGGAFTFGGRGGRVIVVTSLEDEGPGTLREACEQGGARIVVFNVAGIIRLKSPLILRAPYITIAGQTAPGDGICVAGESFWINTHDVIIRHMRFRRGETWVGRRDDAIGGNPIGNIMIDHVSASWGLDENMSIYRHMYNDSTGKTVEQKLPTVNITIQNSIFSEALDTWNHAFGSTLGGENCTFIRNLWADNAGRNPSIGWNGIFNFVNNVVFNWVHRSVDGGDYKANFNIINNYFKPGPLTPKDLPVGYRILKPESGRSQLDHSVFGRAFVNGNIMEGNDRVTKDNWDGGVQVEDLPDAGQYKELIKWNEPLPMPAFPIMTAAESYPFVLENAGATLPRRDPVDIRIIGQVRDGKFPVPEMVSLENVPRFKSRRLPVDSYKNGIITDISQVGGYPEYKGTPVTDTDMDGMPDEWEVKYRLNPKDPSDAALDCNGDGYTNIEKYINGLDPEKKVDWTKPENNVDPLMKNEAESYLNTARQRAEKIVVPMNIHGREKAERVMDLITEFYVNLHEIHGQKDNPQLEKAMENNHRQFVAGLEKELTKKQVEKVKDGITYGILPKTNRGYQEMLPGLTGTQKAKILEWLKEAREKAMDGGTSEEKHTCFGKYKGKINNYLSAEGYDLKKAGEEWEKRIREKK